MTNSQHPQSEEPEVKNQKLKLWLKRLGLAGFLFFLVKGLIWIAIFTFAAKGCGA